MTAQAARVEYDPLRDKSYEATALGRDVVDFLAWKRLGGTSERTLLDYEWALKFLCLAYPRLKLAKATDAEVLHILGRFPARSRRERAAAYAQFFKWARLTRRIGENPMELVPTIKRPRQRVIDVFTDAEREALLALERTDGTLMRILLEQGLRKGEARRLQVRNVLPPTPDAPNGQLAILHAKGDKDRLVPLTRTCAQAIAELTIVEGLEARDHFWYDRPGGAKIRRSQPIGETVFVRWWSRCVEQSGVRYRNPHVTRHTFATRWLRRGGRLETLSEALGHESIKTTYDLYGHLDTSDIARDLALVESEE